MQQRYHQDIEALALLVEKSSKAFVARHLFAVSFEKMKGGDLSKIILFGKQVRRDTSDGEGSLESSRRKMTEHPHLEIFGVDLEDDAASYVRPGVKITL